MKRRWSSILVLGPSLLFASGCSSNSTSNEEVIKTERALTIVKRVCDGENGLNWEQRANLAAQANFLDNRWERLADASFVQAADSLIVDTLKEGKNFADYPEPALTKVYESKVQYSKFRSECSILELFEEEDE